MTTRLAGSQRVKGKHMWTVKSFTHQHENPVEAARIAHAMCDEYKDTYNSKHTDSFQEVALIGVKATPVLAFSPFAMQWVCMVSATFEALRYERKRSMSSEPTIHNTVDFGENMEFVPLDADSTEQEYRVLVH